MVFIDDSPLTSWDAHPKSCRTPLSLLDNALVHHDNGPLCQHLQKNRRFNMAIRWFHSAVYMKITCTLHERISFQGQCW